MVDQTAKRGMLKYRWVILITLLVAYFFVYFHRMAPAVMNDAISGSLGLSDGEFALITSVYFYTYLAMQIPSGLLADKFGPRYSAGLFLLLAALGSFLTAFSNDLAGLVIGKVMIAAGLAVVYIPMTKVMAVWFRKREFASLNGAAISVGNVGAIAASAPLVLLMGLTDWRGVFLILAIVTVILGLASLLLVRNHPSERGYPSIEDIEEDEGVVKTESTSEKIPMIQGLKTVFMTGGMKFWMPTLAYFFVFGSIMLYAGLWGVKFYEVSQGFPQGSAAIFVMMVGVGKVISPFILGMVTDKYGLSRKRIMIFGNICFFSTLVVMLFFMSSSSFWMWIFVNFMFGFFGGFMSLSFAQVKEWFPTALSARVIAGMNMFLFAGAAILQSVSALLVSGKTATFDDYQNILLMMAICVAIACVLISLSVEKKRERV